MKYLDSLPYKGIGFSAKNDPDSQGAVPDVPGQMGQKKSRKWDKPRLKTPDSVSQLGQSPKSRGTGGTKSRAIYKPKLVRLLLLMGHHERNMVSLTRLCAYMRNHGLRRRQSVYKALKQLDSIGFLRFRTYPDKKTFVGYIPDYPLMDSIRRRYNIQQAPLKEHKRQGDGRPSHAGKKQKLGEDFNSSANGIAAEGDAGQRSNPLTSRRQKQGVDKSGGICARDNEMPGDGGSGRAPNMPDHDDFPSSKENKDQGL